MPMKVLLTSLFAICVGSVFATVATRPIGDAFLGVTVAEEIPEAISAHLGVHYGAMLSSVIPGSPADAAGLKKHDIVVASGTEKIEAPEDLVRVIQSKEPGGRLALSVRRGSKTLELELELGDKSDVDTPDGPPERPRGFLGVRFGIVPPVLASHLNLEANTGTVVEEVLEGSAAQRAGLEPFDVITAVAGERVEAQQTAGAELSIHPRFEPQGQFWYRHQNKEGRVGDPSADDSTRESAEEGEPTEERSLGRWIHGIDGEDGVELDLHVQDDTMPGTLHFGAPTGSFSIASNLPDLIARYRAGDEVELRLIRRGQPLELKVVLGERPDDRPAEGTVPPGLFLHPDGSGEAFPHFFGKPLESTRGKLRLRTEGGDEHVIVLPDLEGRRLELETLLESLREVDKNLPESVEESLRKALEKAHESLDFKFKVPDNLRDGRRPSGNPSSEKSVIVVDDGQLRIRVEDEDGKRRLTIHENGKAIAENLDWQKLDELPKDLRPRVDELLKDDVEGTRGSWNRRSKKQSKKIEPDGRDDKRPQIDEEADGEALFDDNHKQLFDL